MSLVSLVGAGPGDPGLLTVKAMSRLRGADLVIYDILANPAHLSHAKKNAVKICVGKRFRHHPFSQKKINRLILSAAKKGQNVVRLKGGDPYLFGRGGEEALFLREHKVPFEVVPGVTSATACAAYSGIPLTHREHNSSVTFLTGHKAHDENLDGVPWEKIVAIGGTLVIYMGFYNLKVIAARLMRAGASERTPVSVIEWGTLPRQKSCVGTLRNIATKVEQKNLSAPAIIIVGEVVRLSEKLNWFENLPLFGKTVVVTRMREKAGALRARLEELGAQVIEFPVIEIEPLSDFKELDKAINECLRHSRMFLGGNHPDDPRQKIAGMTNRWIVFTSVYGVEAFFGRLKSHKKDPRALGSVKIASVGSETSRALNGYGVIPDLEPARFETKAVVQAFAKRFKNLKGQKFILFRTDIAPPELEEGLRKLGAEVEPVTAYKTRLSRVSSDMKRSLSENKIDAVTFTSSSAVENFINVLGLAFVKKTAKKARFASIGPVTSKTLRRHGFKPACEAKIFTIEGLANAMKKSL